MRDLPCAVCGDLMNRVAKSLPEGRATCHSCRRRAREAASTVRSMVCHHCGVIEDLPAGTPGRAPTRCGICAKAQQWLPTDATCHSCASTFRQKAPNQRYCSPGCRRVLRARSDRAVVRSVDVACRVSVQSAMAWQDANARCELWVGWVTFCPHCNALASHIDESTRGCLSCGTEIRIEVPA